MEIKLGDKFEDKEGYVYELVEYESCGTVWLRDVNDNEAGWMHCRNLEEANKYINKNIDLGKLKPIKPSTDYDKMLKIKELLEILRVLQKSSMGLYYITDVIKIMNTKGLKTGGVLVEDNTEILSLNTKLQLEMLTRILKIRIKSL